MSHASARFDSRARRDGIQRHVLPMHLGAYIQFIRPGAIKLAEVQAYRPEVRTSASNWVQQRAKTSSERQWSHEVPASNP